MFSGGDGVNQCSLDLINSARCHDNPTNDGRKCWWKWDCTAVNEIGNYRAKFDNKENCPKEINYNVGTALENPTPTPTKKPTLIVNEFTPTPTPTRIVLPQSGFDFPSQALTILGTIVTLVGFLILL
jgi:hypothetical protein